MLASPIAQELSPSIGLPLALYNSMTDAAQGERI
jgi:hypothetical protein